MGSPSSFPTLTITLNLLDGCLSSKSMRLLGFGIKDWSLDQFWHPKLMPEPILSAKTSILYMGTNFGTSFGCKNWSRGPTLATKTGSGDQLWPPKLVPEINSGQSYKTILIEPMQFCMCSQLNYVEG